MLRTVRKTFLTPFDRGAITSLIVAMDDAIDEIQDTARAIDLYELRSFTPEMKQMVALIDQSAGIVAEAIPLLRSLGPNAARLSALAEEITRLEGRADELHDEGLKQLYRGRGRENPMTFLVGSEVYSRLEKVVDSFEDVADEISAILIEHL